MITVATYTLNSIEQLLEGFQTETLPQFSELRSAARSRVQTLGFPNQKMEEWRFINLKNLLAAPFSNPSEKSVATTDIHLPDSQQLAGITPISVYFVDGVFRADLSALDQLPAGVVVTTFSQASGNSLLNSTVGTIAVDDQHPFMALNSTLFTDGLFIHAPKDVKCPNPIHVINVVSDQASPILVNPRLLAIAEESANLTIIESYIGPENLAYFVNSVSEFVVKPEGNIDHYRLQLDGTDAFHFATLDARQEEKSHFSTQTFSFGGKLTRNDTGLHMDGAYGLGIMNGVYQLKNQQVVDNHTRIDHAFPNCETHELFKGILDDQSRGVFNGRIFVRQIAQKTDSKQTNRTLLLSSDALINTNPQLEIFADDVKCTHGATIGQIEETQLYYLKSRGISEDEARRILVFAFANDVVEKVTYSPLRSYLEEHLLQEQETRAQLV